MFELTGPNLYTELPAGKLPTPELALLEQPKTANLHTSSVLRLKLKLISQSEAEMNPTHILRFNYF